MESPPPLLKKFEMSFMISRAHPFQWPSPSLSLPHQDEMNSLFVPLTTPLLHRDKVNSLRPDGRGGGWRGPFYVPEVYPTYFFHIAVDL
jgi:hypothetical protein